MANQRRGCPSRVAWLCWSEGCNLDGDWICFCGRLAQIGNLLPQNRDFDFGEFRLAVVRALGPVFDILS